MSRVILLTSALVLAVACNAEPAVTVSQPQKSALRMCYGQSCAPAPMLVLDGHRVDFESARLNPHDIAQVEILRGDSAVAKFGEDARSGVVIVTSRKPPPRHN